MKKLRKSGVLSLVATVFFFFYVNAQLTPYGNSIWDLMSGPLDYFSIPVVVPILCYVIGAFTPPLVSLILFLCAGFIVGITGVWGIASIILAVVAFFEWRHN